MAKSCQSIVQDKIGEMTECSICAEIFTNPKVLPCVHTFCLHCLENYGKDKQPGSLLVCPICRNEFAIPDGGLCKLPHNFFIGQMVEVRKLAMTSVEEALCNICPEGEEKIAKMYCVDCEQILCERCTKSHKKTKHCMDHQAVELGSGLRTQEFKLRNSYCDQHPKEIIKMYCHKHSEAICLICCVESHQSHMCVNIEKAAEEFTERLKEDRKTVIKRLPECKETGDKLDKYKKEFTEEISKTEESIRDIGTKLKHLIDQHTEVLIQNLKSIRDRNLKAFEVTKEDVERFTVVIDSFEKYSEELLSGGSPVDICRAANQMHLRATELEIMPVNSNGTTFCCDTVSFYSSDIESSLYQCKSKNLLGELTVTPSPHRIIKFDTGGSALFERHYAAINAVAWEHLTSDDAIKEVSNIPVDMTPDTLQMIFENKRFGGGGDVINIKYEKERGTAVITLSDPEVAASLLKKEVVEFKGHRMLVTAQPGQVVDATPGYDSYPENSIAKLQTSPISAVSGSFNTIKISVIPQDVSEDMISMYFESKKRSGGGKHRLLEYQKEKGKVVVQFNDPKDALEVCKRIHVLCGRTLSISALEMPLDDVSSCAIEVKGLSEKVTENFLELYFENKNRSGGGPVEKLFLNKEAKSAVIIFKEPKAVMGVMDKRPHKLDGASLEVNVLEPAPPPPLLLKDIDGKRLLAKRLPPSAAMESLREYLSPAARTRMLGWTLAAKPSTALLDFSSEPDYLSIRRLVCSKPFLGQMISIRRVPRTSSILVTGIPSSVSADCVAMYFENPRNVGTSAECEVEMLSDRSSAIVKFEQPDIICEITQKRHLFGKVQVKVEPYYPWLGGISVSESRGTVPANKKSEIPTSVTFSFDAKAVHFIQKRPELQKDIEDSLKKLNCHISWPSEGKEEVRLEFKGKENQKPIAGWDGECEKVLQRYAGELTWKKENVLQEMWIDFKQKIQEYSANKPKLIDIAFENDQCEIQYIGLKKDTDEFEKTFKKIKGELEEELERNKKGISETISNLKSHHLSLIGTKDFQKKLKQEFPNVDFEIKTTEVNLCGMPDAVKKAKLFLYEKVTAAVQDSFEISESVSKLYTKDEAKSYLVQQLLSKGISASWMCNDKSVVVFALDDKNVKEAIEVLKTEVVEARLKLHRLLEDFCQSDQWKDFITSLCEKDKLLAVYENRSVIFVACMRSSIEKNKRSIEGFLISRYNNAWHWIFSPSLILYQWQ